MDTAQQRTITAFFRDRTDAEEAINELVSAGILKDDVRLVSGKESDSVAATDTDQRRGFWDSLADFFFPAEDREVYAEGLRRGGYLVTVSNLDAAQHKIALDILDDEGTIDVDQWSDSWRAEGWTPSNTGYESDQAANAARARQTATNREDAFDAGRTSTSDNVVGTRDPELRGSRVRSYLYDKPEDNLGTPPRV
jgi:hypothetical protein